MTNEEKELREHAKELIRKWWIRYYIRLFFRVDVPDLESLWTKL